MLAYGTHSAWIFCLYLFTVRYISAIKRIPGAVCREQSLMEHKKLPKAAGKTSAWRSRQQESSGGLQTAGGESTP